jgi:quercetin dioxygenase-like cupin family protein
MNSICRAALIGVVLATPALGASDNAAVPSPANPSVAPPDPTHVEIVPGKDIKWKDGMGAHQALLFGDPNKPGIYGVLIKWDPGNFSKPHFHSTDRYAYVVSGTWWISSSTTYDPGKTYPVPAGSYVRDIANTVHWDGAKDEPCVLMLVGMGPMTTTQVGQAVH